MWTSPHAARHPQQKRSHPYRADDFLRLLLHLFIFVSNRKSSTNPNCAFVWGTSSSKRLKIFEEKKKRKNVFWLNFTQRERPRGLFFAVGEKKIHKIYLKLRKFFFLGVEVENWTQRLSCGSAVQHPTPRNWGNIINLTKENRFFVISKDFCRKARKICLKWQKKFFEERRLRNRPRGYSVDLKFNARPPEIKENRSFVLSKRFCGTNLQK